MKNEYIHRKHENEKFYSVRNYLFCSMIKTHIFLNKVNKTLLNYIRNVVVIIFVCFKALADSCRRPSVRVTLAFTHCIVVWCITG